MAHVFKLQLGGVDAVDLMDSSHGNDYAPATPLDGALSVAESFRLTIKGTSATDLQTKVQAMEDLLRRARETGQEGDWDSRVTVVLQPNGASAAYTSQILGGSLDVPASTFGVDWANKEVDCILSWVRSPFWEGALVALNLSSSNGLGNQSKVYEANDGSGTSPNIKFNWLYAAKADIKGVLPAPVQLIVNPFAAGVDLDDLYVFNYIEQDAYPLLGDGMGQHEGETGSGDSSDATRSGGAFHSYTIAAAGTLTRGWGITTEAEDYGAQYARFMLGAKFSAGVTIQPYVKLNGEQTFYGPKSVFPAAKTSFSLIDLGLMRILPQRLYGSWTMYSVEAGIIVTSQAGCTFDLDYLQMIPNGYGLRIQALGTAHAVYPVESFEYQNNLDVFNPVGCILNLITSKWYGMCQVTGNLMLYPGKDNYLVFKWSLDGVESPQQACQIFLSYAPRYKTL